MCDYVIDAAEFHYDNLDILDTPPPCLVAFLGDKEDE